VAPKRLKTLGFALCDAIRRSNEEDAARSNPFVAGDAGPQPGVNR